jgi:hypothetical protein
MLEPVTDQPEQARVAAPLLAQLLLGHAATVGAGDHSRERLRGSWS